MKPWLRRILLLVVILGLIGIGAGVAAWQALGAEPDWYNDALQRSQQAVASPDTAIINAASAVNERYRQPDGEVPIELTLSEAQLNGSLQGRSSFDAAKALTDNLEDPVFDLRPGKITLAGRVVQLGKVVALTVEPSVQDGQLRMQISSLRGGRLPLPTSMLDRWREPALSQLRRQDPQWREDAELKTNDLANDAAAAAVHARIAEALLAEEPVDAVLMLPVDEGRSGWMPVRVESLEVTDDALTIRLLPLSVEERRTLIDGLH